MALEPLTFLIAIALVLGACGVSSENKAYSGLELDKPRPMPDPILIDTQGQRFAMRSDAGSVRLVYFSSHPAPIFVLFTGTTRRLFARRRAPKRQGFYS